MVEPQQLIFLPAEMLESMYSLYLSPLGLIPQRGQRDQLISSYSYYYYDLNPDILKIDP